MCVLSNRRLDGYARCNNGMKLFSGLLEGCTFPGGRGKRVKPVFLQQLQQRTY
jgi:hypothetical protein